jgi:hypothetical protein
VTAIRPMPHSHDGQDLAYSLLFLLSSLCVRDGTSLSSDGCPDNAADCIGVHCPHDHAFEHAVEHARKCTHHSLAVNKGITNARCFDESRNAINNAGNTTCQGPDDPIRIPSESRIVVTFSHFPPVPPPVQGGCQRW